MAELLDWERQAGQRMRLRDLRVLLAVAKSGSMVKAAAELRVTQPAVSKAIASLEATLGVRLFDRSPRGAQSTIYGDALIKCGSIVFDEMRRAVQQIESLANPTEGEVHVGCPESLAGLVSAVISRLSVQYPKIVVHTRPAFPALLHLDDLRNRNVDLLLGRVPRPVVEDEFDVETLFQDRLLVVAGSSHPCASGRKTKLSSLLKERWILLPEGNPLSLLMTRAFGAGGLDVPRAAVSSVSLHMTNHLLATGRFLTLMFSAAFRENAKRWNLKSLPIELSVAPPPVGVLSLKHRTPNPVAQFFVAEARLVAKSFA
jgi:DNA-binding transcriptional LysR family regulator